MQDSDWKGIGDNSLPKEKELVFVMFVGTSPGIKLGAGLLRADGWYVCSLDPKYMFCKIVEKYRVLAWKELPKILREE